MALLLGLGLIARPDEVRADIFGGDIPLLAGILTQSIATVTNLVQQLNALRTQITLIQAMLSHLEVHSFSDVQRIVSTSQMAYNTLVANVQAIDYTVASVNRDFHRIFPLDQSQTKQADLDPQVGRWQTELLGSALVAERSQSSVTTLSQNTNEANAILSRSSGATGQVAQLQAIVQMLAVIQSQTNLLVQSLDTASRVSGNMAASSAAERILSREKKRRNMQNYTNRGSRVTVLTRLPDPH